MHSKELKAELEKRLADIKQKIQEVQNGIDEEDAPSVELEDILVKLKALQENLILLLWEQDMRGAKQPLPVQGWVIQQLFLP